AAGLAPAAEASQNTVTAATSTATASVASRLPIPSPFRIDTLAFSDRPDPGLDRTPPSGERSPPRRASLRDREGTPAVKTLGSTDQSGVPVLPPGAGLVGWLVRRPLDRKAVVGRDERVG